MDIGNGKAYSPLLDNESKAKWTVRFFGMACVLLVFEIYHYTAQIDLLERIIIGREASLGEIAANERIQIALLFGVLVSLVMATVFFLMWFHSVYLNLKLAGLNLTDEWNKL
ncbi:hypothetical protein GCM10007415_42150 [Parapedobacter pyrenivorans]|uniref:Uncharacterized protein n=1 Tax=Parapedobacter pyrenivorans TaxID=1305674 RepID=A0A917MGT7_9SPHI|nr:hypothetical protein [Parapedobacter pyrenivorans]GGH01606.1 hypothetical protein GCM10007415_42150 [Parapedobacter pyrenivorans]